MYIDALFGDMCVCVTTRQRKPNVWECLGFGGLGELEVFGFRGFRGERRLECLGFGGLGGKELECLGFGGLG